MNWEQAIERQRSALAGIVTTLFAMVGLDEGSAAGKLPLPLYRAVLRILYPAESAVRRLIVAVARGLVWQPPVHRPAPVSRKSPSPKTSPRPSFRLCDPRRTFNLEPRRKGPRFEPRIHAFRDGRYVTILGQSPFEPAPGPDDGIDAKRLTRRLAAIQSALENLPREAKRLARWRARQAKLPPERIRRILRFGRPPGHRRKSIHEVDEVLKDCHWLAREAAKLDTS